MKLRYILLFPALLFQSLACPSSETCTRSPHDLFHPGYRAILLPSSQANDDIASSVEKVTDGNPDTLYRSCTGTFPNWIECRWPQPVKAGELRLRFPKKTAVPESIELKARLLDGNWITVFTIKKSDTLSVVKKFPVVECTAMKVILGPCPVGRTEIAEMEITGKGAKRLLPDSHWLGKYIWYPEGPVDNAERYFRRTFYIDRISDIEKAVLQISADDAWTGYCNGQPIGTGGVPTRIIDLKPFLKTGKNVLAFSVKEFTIDEGLLLELMLADKKNGRITLVSNEQFKAAKTVSGSWYLPDFDDSSWVNAKASGRSSRSTAYHTFPPSKELLKWCSIRIPSEIKLKERLKFHITFQIKEKLFQNFGFRVSLADKKTLIDNSDYRVAEVDVIPGIPTSKWKPGRDYTVPVDIFIPDWAPDGIMPVKVKAIAGSETHHLSAPANAKVKILRFDKPVTHTGVPACAKVKKVGDSPKLFINGKMVAPFIMTESNEQNSFQTSGAYSRIKAPITRVMFSANFYGNTETEKAANLQTVLGNMDQHIRMALRQNHETYLLVGSAITPPAKWNSSNPRDCTALPNGLRLNHSFSSEKYLKESAEGLKAMVHHIRKSDYADKVIGFHFGVGDGPETYYFGAGVNSLSTPREKLNFGDFSPVAIDSFRKWLRTYYNNNENALRKAWKNDTVTFDSAVPLLSELQRKDYGVFRNPAKGRMAMDFWTFQSDSVANAVKIFAGAIKEASNGEMICGLWGFYNTSINHCNMSPGKGQHIGYTGVGTVLDDPNLDYIAAIQGYAGVNQGSPVVSTFTYENLRRKGKLFLEEYDIRTFFTDLTFAASHHYSQFETHSIIKRDFGKSIAHDYACWWVGFPLGREGRRSVGWFNEDSLLSLLHYCSAVRSATVEYPHRSVAEVGVFVNDRDIVAMDPYHGDPVLASARYNFITNTMNLLGTPFDLNSIHDFSPENCNQYKVLVFADAYYLTAGQRAMIEKVISQGKKTVVWLYAPALVDSEHGIRKTYTENITRIKLEQLSRPRSGNQLNVTLTGTDKLTAGLSGLSFTAVKYPYDQRVLLLDPVFKVNDPEAVELGIFSDNKETAIAVKRRSNRTDIYCAIPDFPRDLMSHILAESGVHRYTKDEVYLEAGNRFISVHAKEYGAKGKIQLPEAHFVYDVFRKKFVSGEAVKEFVPDIAPYASELFFLGTEEECLALDASLPEKPEPVAVLYTKEKLEALAGAPAVVTGNILNPETVSAWTGSVSQLQNNRQEKALQATGSSFLFSKDILKIDSTHRYQLSGKFKLVKGSLPSKIYFGLLPVDQDGKIIQAVEVQACSGTETVLTAPVEPGDRVVKVRNATNWKPLSIRRIAFDADPAGTYNDLPNRNVTAGGILSIRNSGTEYEVTLDKPVQLRRPAGTAVRQHENAPPYIYIGAGGADIPDHWFEFKGDIGGIAGYGASDSRWWKGTKGAKIVLLINYAGNSRHKSFLKDIKLEKVEF